MASPSIFISCGQRPGEEIQLAEELVDLVRSTTSFEPWYAGEGSGGKGLQERVFEGLASCEGIISVLHARTPVTRDGAAAGFAGPVWVEQELAIASFLEAHEQKPFRTMAFAQEGVQLDGLRRQILWNPIIFRTNAEVLEHARSELATWAPSAPWPVSIELRFSCKDRRPERHVYRCEAYVINHGAARLDWYEARVTFPRFLLSNSTSYTTADARLSTHDSMVFVHAAHKPLSPQDERLAWGVDFFVDNDAHQKLCEQPVQVICELHTDGRSLPPVSEDIYEHINF